MNARLCAAQQPGTSQVIVIMMMSCSGYHLVPPNLSVQILCTDIQCAESGTLQWVHPAVGTLPAHSRTAGIWQPEVQCNRQLFSMHDSKACLRCDSLGSAPLWGKYLRISSLTGEGPPPAFPLNLIITIFSNLWVTLIISAGTSWFCCCCLGDLIFYYASLFGWLEKAATFCNERERSNSWCLWKMLSYWES